jgi:hypothetical protein
MSTRVAQLFYGVKIPKELYEKLLKEFYPGASYPQGESKSKDFELEFFYDSQECYLLAKGTNNVTYDHVLHMGQVLPVTHPSNPQRMIDFIVVKHATKLWYGEPEWLIMPN